jgi:hypoxanthine phosphoribosyltransferase
MKMRNYTWEEFDQAVAKIERPICDYLCPVPRGGLILAVALSHKFGIPLAHIPTRNCAYIDDIADTGETLINWKLLYGNYPSVVLIRRSSCSSLGIQAAEVIDTDDWIVFPWENKEKAQEDYDSYITRK